MKVSVFSAKPYDREFLQAANQKAGSQHELCFFDTRLNAQTASLAQNTDAVCVFVHDHVDADVLNILSEGGCCLVALRCAGFNNVDLKMAEKLGIAVVRVPAYSPEGVAEFAAGLLLTLNRKIHRAAIRVREQDFSLNGLLGFDIHNKTLGVLGTGKIGACFCRIMTGFGCRILAYDVHESDEVKKMGVSYVTLDKLFRESDIISFHCPLTPETHHILNKENIQKMKRGVMLINTSRGALMDTTAVIRAIKSGQIGSLAMDVYEEEEGIFYEDLSERIITDDALARLTTFPNVLLTSHQAFFTQEAMESIADTTIDNITEFARSRSCKNTVTVE